MPMKPATLGASLSWDAQMQESEEQLVTAGVHDHEDSASGQALPAAAEPAVLASDIPPSPEIQMSIEAISSSSEAGVTSGQPSSSPLPLKPRLEPYESVLTALLSRIPFTMDGKCSIQVFKLVLTCEQMKPLKKG